MGHLTVIIVCHPCKEHVFYILVRLLNSPFTLAMYGLPVDNMQIGYISVSLLIIALANYLPFTLQYT